MTTHVFDSNGLSDAELKKAVGQRYHCGLSDGTRFYGYMFEPVAGKDGGFRWRTDITTKEALTQYSSGQLIDRDLAFFPRVTDGDFSNGGYQEVFLDTKRYFDADLDPRVPGFLQLRHSWTRVTKAGLPNLNTSQVVAWNGDFWFTFGETNGNIYSANGGTTTSPTAATIVSLDTDGAYLYAGTAGGLWRSLNGSTWTAVTSSVNGIAQLYWIIQQGTNGYFAYYRTASGLYKIDLTQAFPIAAGAQPQVPTGGNNFFIVDIVPYQTSLAILTRDNNGGSSDVWYFDGANLTRIIRLDGYIAAGMCNTLGSLYVSMYSPTKINSPILAQVSSGSLTVVARPGSPFVSPNQTCGQPRGSNQYVYWPVYQPSINGISSAPGVVLQYDTQTGAVSHLPNQDATDMHDIFINNLHSVATIGDEVATCFANGLTGFLQYQTPSFGTLTYMPSGWLVSSHIDFATPGIVKRFRRLEVHHAPLRTGEQIFIECFVDQDPLAFTTGLAPVPASQSGGTNSTVGSTLTSLLLGQDTVGKTLYFAVKLTAGAGQLTTPRVSFVTVEVGGTWVADLNLACTQRRQLLTQESDTQGASAADLAYLIALAYENGNLLTFYHPNGQTYTMAVETQESWNPSPTSRMQSQDNRPLTEEYIVHTILRQVA